MKLTKEQQFISHCALGEIEKARALLKTHFYSFRMPGAPRIPGININFVGENGLSALHQAIRMDQIDTVGFLLKLPDIDVNVKGTYTVDRIEQTPFYTACCRSQEKDGIEMITLLLNNPSVDVNCFGVNHSVKVHSEILPQFASPAYAGIICNSRLWGVPNPTVQWELEKLLLMSPRIKLCQEEMKSLFSMVLKANAERSLPHTHLLALLSFRVLCTLNSTYIGRISLIDANADSLIKEICNHVGIDVPQNSAYFRKAVTEACQLSTSRIEFETMEFPSEEIANNPGDVVTMNPFYAPPEGSKTKQKF